VPDRRPDDLLTARDLADQYGFSRSTAESIVRRICKDGKGYSVPNFRRVFVKRADVEPVQSSGGMT
jgi:hypothetical protein